MASSIAGENILIIGGNKGLGYSIVTECVKREASKIYVAYRSSSKTNQIHTLPNTICKSGIDLTQSKSFDELLTWLEHVKIDVLIIVAGIFLQDQFGRIDYENVRKSFEVCSIAPLKIVEGLVGKGILGNGGKIVLITSEGGSIGIRCEKEGGGNYGHHMSKAAENMMGRILAWDLKEKGIAVQMIHPGFVRTGMTEHYSGMYDELGAVESDVAAKGVVDAAEKLGLENTGKFIQPLGSKHLGFGVWGLDDADKRGPFSELPF